MKKILSFLRSPILLLFFLLIYIVSLGQSNSKIGIYELLTELVATRNDVKEVKRYEINNLFIKSVNGWIMDTTYKRKASFYMIEDGRIFNKIDGHYRKTTSFKNYPTLFHYKPQTRIVLKSQPDPSITLSNDSDSYQSCIVTNNQNFKQTLSFVKYAPNKEDLSLIRKDIYPYLKEQFVEHCEMMQQWNEAFIADTFFREIVEIDSFKIDSLNTFIAGNGNKIITVIVPYNMNYATNYPFSDRCFREDNGYAYRGLRTTCCIKQSKVNFLHDELTYVAHGDFDNDGKEEFLFSYSIFNHDGYLLYYNDFNDVAEIMWSYH